MHPRAAAALLLEIATLLELRGSDRFRARAFRRAGRALQALPVEDITPLIRSGELGALRSVGPVSLSVLREATEQGDSSYLQRLRESTPEGLVEMLRVPGLGTTMVQRIHAGLGIESVEELEAAARDGRLAAMPRLGKRSAERILKGIELQRQTGSRSRYPDALAQAHGVLHLILRHPLVARAEIAGSLRRRREVIGDVDIVAACRAAPEQVAGEVAGIPGVRAVVEADGAATRLTFRGGLLVDLYCVDESAFAVALWRATGSAGHCEAALAAAGAQLTTGGDKIRKHNGELVQPSSEPELYAALGLSFVEPELREDGGEVEAARAGRLPRLVAADDIRGILHCHSEYSDGTTSIEAMATDARARGWSYLGVTDHSQSAYYAGGLAPDEVLRQHDEIDAVNASLTDFRVLKGVEADILADGRVDYDESLLDRFEFVIASVHSRFGMPEAQMTERILRALDDPHVTVLGHPTGRLLLTREPYALDVEAVIEKLADVGAAVELNADPHRLDLDWRFLRTARDRGVSVEIGPDAHSTAAFDNMEIGIGIARKGWLAASDVLNTRSADGVLAFARARRERRTS